MLLLLYITLRVEIKNGKILSLAQVTDKKRRIVRKKSHVPEFVMRKGMCLAKEVRKIALLFSFQWNSASHGNISDTDGEF